MGFKTNWSMVIHYEIRLTLILVITFTRVKAFSWFIFQKKQTKNKTALKTENDSGYIYTLHSKY